MEATSSSEMLVEWKRNVMAHVQKPDLVFQRNGRVHLYRRGCQFSRVLALLDFGSAENDCIIVSKYVDHRLKMLLQGRKKRVKRSGEREKVYNVYKFMKTESEMGIAIPLPKVQKRVVEATLLAEELYVWYWKKVKMWKLVSQWHFKIRANSDQKFALKVS